MMNRREFLKSTLWSMGGLALSGMPGSLSTFEESEDDESVWYTTEVGAHWPSNPHTGHESSIVSGCLVVTNGEGLSHVTYNIMLPDVEWHEIELYGYWSIADLPLGGHYGLSIEEPRTVSVFSNPRRYVLPWEWAWYEEHVGLPWRPDKWSKFPITDGERIEALGRYLGYL